LYNYSMITYILMITGFILLVKGADFLVDGASSMARRFNVSDLVIGLTVVAFGTSTPELFVNIIASFSGSTDIAIGNVLGSNIANTLLILGVSSIIYPLSVTRGTVWKEIPFSLLAAVVLGIMANDQILDKASVSAITRIDGLVLLCFFAIFLYYSFSIAGEINGMDSQVPQKKHGVFRSVMLIAAGLTGLGLGGKWIVDGAVRLASVFGMSESLIGLTIVAVGTSLPELATSAVAAYRKKTDIAVGNVVGSNIFNIFLVLGISSSINPLPFQQKNNLDIGMVIFSSVLLFAAMFSFKKQSLDRWEGAGLLTLYVIYIGYLIVTGI
jgi:cation:H+ antiporter